MFKVLIACEESQEVTRAFRRRGFEAFSCDLRPCSGGHPQWHLQQDVGGLLGLDWDLIIAFPPCTHLSSSGARWWSEKKADGRQGEAIRFFRMFTDLRCPRVAIENPVGIMSTEWRKPDQSIQPYEHGHGETKRTCLWLKGLPLLKPSNPVSGRESNVLKVPSNKDRGYLRSKTYPGVAEAMADQWGAALKETRYKNADIGWRMRDGGSLYDHQVGTYKRFLKYPRFSDGSQAGTGKTLAAQNMLIRRVSAGTHISIKKREVKHGKQVNGIILAPASPLDSWEASLKTVEIDPRIKVVFMRGTVTKRERLKEEIKQWVKSGGSVIMVMSWSLLKEEMVAWILTYLKPHHGIFDEFQWVMGPDSDRTYQFRSLYDGLLRKGVYLYGQALSATFWEDGWHKGYDYFRFLYQGLDGTNKEVPSMEHFETMFWASVTEVDGHKKYSGLKNKDLFAKLARGRNIRHMRADVIANRKAPIYSTLRYEMAAKSRNLHQEFMRLYMEAAAQFTSGKGAMFGSASVSRRLVSCPEFYELPEDTTRRAVLMETLKEVGIRPGVIKDKLLIITEFTLTLANLVAFLRSKGFVADGLGGGMNKAKVVDKFNREGQILVLNRAVTEGLNLQSANIIINFELGTKPGIFTQANGRTDRQGQRKNQFIITIVAKGTTDENAYRKIIKNTELADYVAEPEEVSFNKKRSVSPANLDILKGLVGLEIEKLKSAAALQTDAQEQNLE